MLFLTKFAVLKSTSTILSIFLQVNRLLQKTHEKNPRILPGLLDPRSLPKADEVKLITSEHEYNKVEKTARAMDFYGCAYRQSSYRCFLDDFLRFGTVMRTLGTGQMYPAEGLLQAASDIYPSSGCSLYNLFCLTTETSVHLCTSL